MKQTVSLRLTDYHKGLLADIGRGSVSKGVESLIEFYKNEEGSSFTTIESFNEGIEKLEEDIKIFAKLFGKTKEGKEKLKKFERVLSKRRQKIEDQMAENIEKQLNSLKIVN